MVGVEKLCSDYSRYKFKNEQEAVDACLILQYKIEKPLSDSKTKSFYKLDDVIKSYLKPIYAMVEYSEKWVKEFWNKITDWYKDSSKKLHSVAKSIIKDTLKCEHVPLAKHLPKELCTLAEMFWTVNPKEKSHPHFGFYQREKMELSHQFGLSDQAESYDYKSSRGSVIMSNFFTSLFGSNFWTGLRWTIGFVNNAVLAYESKNKDETFSYEFYFVDEEMKRSYLGNSQMWLTGSQEYAIPMIISDLVYCLKEKLRQFVKNSDHKDEKVIKFFEAVKKEIFEKSNNIALLTIISEIGMEFSKELPGFALDLVSNLDIVLNDLSKLVGSLSGIGNRYKIDGSAKDRNLRSYATLMQIYHGEIMRKKCYKTFDYLYSIVPNDKENATHYLQIENMDLRKARIENVDENTVALVPVTTGEAKKVVTENDKRNKPNIDAFALVREGDAIITEEKMNLKVCLELIGKMFMTMNKVLLPSMLEKTLIGLIKKVLLDESLHMAKREEFCIYWINGVRKLFDNGIFMFEFGDLKVLLDQVDKVEDYEIKNQIKRLTLDLILYRGQNGIIKQLASVSKSYLRSNKSLASAVLNTIIKIAEDEMSHQKFNAGYIKKFRKQEKFEFIPNLHPKLRGVDIWIQEAKEKEKTVGFQSRREELVAEYLFSEKQLQLKSFCIGDYDISTICYAVNCGMPLNDNIMSKVAKGLIDGMLKVWAKYDDHQGNAHDILDTYALYEVMDAFQRELVRSEEGAKNVLSLLFDDIDFSLFPRDAEKFYLDIFSVLLSAYFDAHNDKNQRVLYGKIIDIIEKRVEAISDEQVKIKLLKSVILATTTYGGSGDWSRCASGYSYSDKEFLNSKFSKHGKYHVKEMLSTIYKLHYSKLLPEIILSIRNVFKDIADAKNQKKNLSELLSDSESSAIVKIIITKSFMDLSKSIKEDEDLTVAFEEILEMLVEINYEEAAVILDEFRVH